jgi:hypothetical protein
MQGICKPFVFFLFFSSNETLMKAHLSLEFFLKKNTKEHIHLDSNESQPILIDSLSIIEHCVRPLTPANPSTLDKDAFPSFLY